MPLKPLSNLKQFNPKKRAYPFPSGVLIQGVNVDDTSVLFRGQRGPIEEVGVNGCQIDDMIAFARLTIEAFNAKFPCRENALAITKLEEAEMWLQRRTQNREARGVEGKNEK
jgi:hypothetical protein